MGILTVRGFQDWLDKLNTTNYKAVWGVWLMLWYTVTGVLLVAAAMWWRRDVPVHAVMIYEGLGWILLAFNGVNALQYVGKRTTDREYAAARHQPPAVNVETAGKVEAQPPAPPAPPAPQPSQPAAHDPGAPAWMLAEDDMNGPAGEGERWGAGRQDRGLV